jgi:hypothetical protein
MKYMKFFSPLPRLIFLIPGLFFIFSLNAAFGQAEKEIYNDSYKFKMMLPFNWSMSIVEETNNKDAVSYSFEKNDGGNAIMLLAFKVPAVKNLDDFIYTLEKDLTLNIPKREGDYKVFDYGSYDGKMAVYKDDEFVETIYFYRTKYEGANYTYMIRFITTAGKYNPLVESEIEEIAMNFKPQ